MKTISDLHYTTTNFIINTCATSPFIYTSSYNTMLAHCGDCKGQVGTGDKFCRHCGVYFRSTRML